LWTDAWTRNGDRWEVTLNFDAGTLVAGPVVITVPGKGVMKGTLNAQGEMVDTWIFEDEAGRKRAERVLLREAFKTTVYDASGNKILYAELAKARGPRTERKVKMQVWRPDGTLILEETSEGSQVHGGASEAEAKNVLMQIVMRPEFDLLPVQQGRLRY